MSRHKPRSLQQKAKNWLGGVIVGMSLLTAPSFAASPESLPNWDSLNHEAALSAFLQSCKAANARMPAAQKADWQALCASAQNVAPPLAKSFFASRFCLAESPVPGFSTGYFEPIIKGSLSQSAKFSAPLLSAPKGLVSVPEAKQRGALQNRTHALKQGNALAPLPDRAAIMNGALASMTKPLVYVAPVDAFFAHIQGSVVVELENGERLNIGYAGKNGHPYTAIGKVIVARGGMAASDVTMQSLQAWLENNPQSRDEVFKANASYIFFQKGDARAAGLGPKGALGAHLTPYASIAVDPSWAQLGFPVYVSGQNLPFGDFKALTIAQDVGTAIKGAGRMDLFTGSGDQAGQIAGLLKHDVRIARLLPNYLCGG